MPQITTGFNRLRTWGLLGSVLAALAIAGLGPSTAGAFIYWSNPGTSSEEKGTIGRANLDGSHVNQRFITGVSESVRGLAVDPAHIYWANFVGPSQNGIGRANLDGSGFKLQFVPSFNNQGIAVDAGHIYWGIAGFGSMGEQIGRSGINGFGVNYEFIRTGLEPHGVAVDSDHIYWTNSLCHFNGGVPEGCNGVQTIGRANLDGGEVEQSFITLGMTSGPTSIAVDSGHIYWGNNDSTIGRANINGTGVDNNFIDIGPLASGPGAIAVDGGHIYWTAPETRKIGRANLNGTGINPAFLSTAEGSYGIAVDAVDNRAPYANGGPNREVESGADVTLSAVKSFDPDSEPLTYRWTQTSGKAVALSGAESIAVHFTAPVGPATLNIGLRVCDVLGACSTDTDIIRVLAPGQTPAPGAGGAAKTPTTCRAALRAWSRARAKLETLDGKLNHAHSRRLKRAFRHALAEARHDARRAGKQAKRLCRGN